MSAGMGFGNGIFRPLLEWIPGATQDIVQWVRDGAKVLEKKERKDFILGRYFHIKTVLCMHLIPLLYA